MWNSWDLAKAVGFVRSKRCFAFSLSLQLVLGVVAISSSLQLGLPLGHQPPPLEDAWRACAGGVARDHGHVITRFRPGFARKAESEPPLRGNTQSASAGFPTPNNRFAYSPTARYETATSKSEAERHCWLDGTMI
jgi:hypothetical protein